MKQKTHFIILVGFIVGQLVYAQQEVGNVLSNQQITQLERGYGMFIHFGINTFNETEWSDGTLPISSYNPTELDCDQWIKTAKEVGFRHVILITKHHEGFCLWDSKYTDYDVASSPVKTDIVAEVAKACKKYGVKLGLYYSLWDRHEPSYRNTKKYHTYMKNQLTELLTNYGEICELWFDGGWDKKDDEWDLQAIYGHIKKLQPNCQVTVNHTIGKPNNISAIRQPVNYQKGDPIRYFPVDFRVKDPALVRWDDPKDFNHKGKMVYLPFEHTICLSNRWNWFQKIKMLPARPVDELEELFYWCTANDNMLIINVSPDQRGLIRTNEKIRLLELADRLGIRGGDTKLPTGPLNMAFAKKVAASSETPENPASNAVDYSLETFWVATDSIVEITIDLDGKKVFDRVVVFEKGKMKNLGDKFSKIRTFQISEFELEAYNQGKWDTFYAGGTIGECKIINLPLEIHAEKVRLKISRSKGMPSISHIAFASNKTKGIRTID